MNAAPSRLKQVSAPSGLMPVAPNLPAQVGTGRRAVASGIGPYSAVHAVTSVGAKNS
jgi:hypothetical protein